MQTAIVYKVNVRPGAVFSDDERPRSEKIDENMLKIKALYLSNTCVDGTKVASALTKAVEARNRKAAESPIERIQNIEIIVIFGMAAGFPDWTFMIFLTQGKHVPVRRETGRPEKDARADLVRQWPEIADSARLPKPMAESRHICR